jgi:alkylation response protein AidB-like acyl-CoA dehydrogenase
VSMPTAPKLDSTNQALQASATASEQARQVEPEAMAAIRKAGLSRLLAPKAFGGDEAPVSAHIRSCRALAHGYAAASGVHMVCAAHTYVVGRFPEQCLREVFGPSPDVLIPGTLAPQGKACQVEGGWLLSGRWQFGSGVDHGPWLLLGAMAVADDGETALPPVHLVVPTADIQVIDTWYTLGMRGTGSKDLAAEGVFVPAHRAMPTRELFRGDFDGQAGPLYRLPVMGGLASMLAATVVGIAERGLGQFVEITKSRKEAYSGRDKSQKVSVQMRLAEAQGEVRLAAMLVEENCTLLDAEMAENNPPLSIERAAHIRWNAVYAVELCRRATERIYAAAGANATFDSSPLQQWFRDINTACHHAICDFDGALEIQGRLALGLSAGAIV